MLGRSVGIVLTSALGAAAFLIPPRISSLKPARSRSFSTIVECPECIFLTTPNEAPPTETQNDIIWLPDYQSDLYLEFSISEDGKQLLLNRGAIYPMEFDASGVAPIPTVDVDLISPSANMFDIATKEASTTPARVTSFLLDTAEFSLPQDEANLLTVTFTVTSLDGMDVTVVPVSLEMLHFDDGTLSLTTIPVPGSPAPEPWGHESTPFGAPTAWPEDTVPAPPCGRLPPSLCNLRDMLFSKPGREPQRPHPDDCPGHRMPFDPATADVIVLEQSDAGRPHPHHPAGPHHGRHGRHGRHGHHRGRHLLHFLRHGFMAGVAAALIPTLAGVAVGVLVSVVGLLVGRFIAAVWFHVVRGGRRGDAGVRLDDCVLAEDEAEKGLLLAMVDEQGEEEVEVVMVGLDDDMEALPAYEHAPAYQERKEEGKS